MFYQVHKKCSVVFYNIGAFVVVPCANDQGIRVDRKGRGAVGASTRIRGLPKGTNGTWPQNQFSLLFEIYTEGLAG